MILSRKALVVDAAALALPWTIFCHGEVEFSGKDPGALRTYGRYNTVIAALESFKLESTQKCPRIAILLVKYLDMTIMKSDDVARVMQCADCNGLTGIQLRYKRVNILDAWSRPFQSIMGS